jgi:hypothetical protein
MSRNVLLLLSVSYSNSVLNTLSLCSSEVVTHQVSHPYRTGNIAALYVLIRLFLLKSGRDSHYFWVAYSFEEYPLSLERDHWFEHLHVNTGQNCFPWPWADCELTASLLWFDRDLTASWPRSDRELPAIWPWADWVDRHLTASWLSWPRSDCELTVNLLSWPRSDRELTASILIALIKL